MDTTNDGIFLASYVINLGGYKGYFAGRGWCGVPEGLASRMTGPVARRAHRRIVEEYGYTDAKLELLNCGP